MLLSNLVHLIMPTVALFIVGAAAVFGSSQAPGGEGLGTRATRPSRVP